MTILQSQLYNRFIAAKPSVPNILAAMVNPEFEALPFLTTTGQHEVINFVPNYIGFSSFVSIGIYCSQSHFYFTPPLIQNAT